MFHMKKIIYIILVIILLPLFAAGGLYWWLNTDSARQWLLDKGVAFLSESLNTEVRADSISVSPKLDRFWLYGFELDDLSKSRMLRVDSLGVDILPYDLLDQKVTVRDIRLLGVDALLYKEKKDSATNFQFVADALRKKTPSTHKKKKFSLQFRVDKLVLSRAHFKWDVRDKRRKNIGRPNRGAFDNNHLDVSLNLTAHIRSKGKDSLRVEVSKLNLVDSASGLTINNLYTTAGIGKRHVSVDSLQIDMLHTHLHTGKVMMTFGKKKEAKDVEFQFVKPFHITATTVLRDISKPFAPRLSEFTTPLNLDVDVSGNISKIKFNNINVTTPDKRLHLTARGNMQDVASHNPKDLNLHFRNIRLSAKNGIKDEIISHFSKKIRLKMMRQIREVGNIHFHGLLDVMYHKEYISGILTTKFGKVNAAFTLNSDTKMMTGTMFTPSFEIGKLMNVKKLGPVKADAQYSFNISSSKKGKGYKPAGHLPQGSLTANIHEARYAIVTFKNICADIDCDGHTANGSISIPRKFIDVLVTFTFTQDGTKQTLSVKPGVKQHRSQTSGTTVGERITGFFNKIFKKKKTAKTS